MASIGFAAPVRAGAAAIPSSGLPGYGAATLLTVLACVAVAAALSAHFGVTVSHASGPASLAVQSGLIALLLRRMAPNLVRLRAVLEGFSLQVTFLLAALVYSYSFQMFALPMRDESFLAFDRAVGFEYLQFMRWIDAHPLALSVVRQAYLSFSPQMLAACLVLPMIGRMREAEIFVLASAGAGLMTSVVSCLLPATGAVLLLDGLAWNHSLAIGATPVHDLLALRDGTMRTVDIARVGGIVSFPSFHMIVAVQSTWVWRRVPVVGPCVAALNVLMAVGAVSEGAHYIADLVAGTAVAILWILLAERWVRQPARI